MSSIIQLPGTKAGVEPNQEHLLNCIEGLRQGVENGSIHSITAVTITDAGAGLFVGTDGANNSLEVIGSLQAALQHIILSGAV